MCFIIFKDKNASVNDVAAPVPSVQVPTDMADALPDVTVSDGGSQIGEELAAKG